MKTGQRGGSSYIFPETDAGVAEKLHWGPPTLVSSFSLKALTGRTVDGAACSSAKQKRARTAAWLEVSRGSGRKSTLEDRQKVSPFLVQSQTFHKEAQLSIRPGVV